MTPCRSASAGEGPVTDRQLDVLRCIERSLAARGFPPTYRELQRELGLRSKQAVRDHLVRLEAMGLLVRHYNEARGLTFTQAARELLATRSAATIGATTP